MPFGTLGVAKQKGGSVGASGHHNDRTRETPNADPERTAQNRVLIGDERNVRESVSEVIEEHGGKPRRDSVEAVELLLSASHEFFEERDGTISREKVERFCEQAVKFLQDRRTCGTCVKAVLHLDERTPHVHAHMVPITPDGRLSASYYLDGREKLRALHDRYAEYMKPLGLERGREGSQAYHQTVKSFYASIMEEVKLDIDHDRVPDPPRVVLTAEAARKYKKEVERSILAQLKEPLKTLRHQAMLAKDERAHREEAERRGDERVAAVEEAGRAKVAEVERLAEGRFATLQRSARSIYDENKELRGERNQLLDERNALHEQVLKEQRMKLDFSAEARKYSDRLTDIPMPEVMEKLGYDGERQGEAHLYRGEGDVVAMKIERQQAFDNHGQLICRNSLDLVMHMRKNNEGVKQFDRQDALRFLVENFGESRAAAAYTVNREQAGYSMIDTLRREVRGFDDPERSRLTPERGRGHDDHGRDGHARDHSDHDRGGLSR